MAQGRSAKEQLGVDLPDPPEQPQAAQEPEAQPEEELRPDYLLDKFKTVDEQARGYAEAEKKINEQAEQQRRLEQQLIQLTEVVEGFQAQPPPQQRDTSNDEAIRARLQESLDSDPIGTIAYLAQNYAQEAIREQFQQIQQQNSPALHAAAERDNQLLAMMVDQRLGETIDDWDDYREKVGEAIVQDQSLIPQEVLINPEATVAAIRRVYQVVKANDIIEQAQNGNFVTQQMKRQAQSLTGGGVRNQDVDPGDEKLDALKNAIVGASYSAWRGQ